MSSQGFQSGQRQGSRVGLGKVLPKSLVTLGVGVGLYAIVGFLRQGSWLLQQHTINWVACKQHKLIFHSSGGWKLEIRVQHTQVRAPFQVIDGQLLAVSLHGRKRVRELSGVFYKGTNLIHGGSALVT